MVRRDEGTGHLSKTTLDDERDTNIYFVDGTIGHYQEVREEVEERFLQENYDDAFTAGSNSTADSMGNASSSNEASCYLCPDGSPLQAADATRVIVGSKYLTCGQVDQKLRENDCSILEHVDSLAFMPANMAGFCGCPHTFASYDCGPLCPPGTMAGKRISIEAVLDDNTTITVACAELDYFVPFINADDSTHCDALAPFRTTCCVGIQDPSCDVCPDGMSTAASATPITTVAVAKTVDSNANNFDSTNQQTPLLGLEVNGIPCEEWVLAATYDNSSSCEFNRIVGTILCGCAVPKNVTGTCSMCPNQSFNALKQFPGSDMTCGDIANVPALDGDDTCNLVQSFSAYCECEGAKPPCPLCPDGDMAQNLTKLIIFYDFTTCEDIAADLSLVTYDGNCQEPISEFFIDIPWYCGCRNVEPPGVCSFCRCDGPLNDPNLTIPELNDTTCGELEDYTLAVTNSSLCPKLEPFADFCCTTRCSLCPQINNNNNSSLSSLPETFASDREIPGLGLTCGDIEATLAYVTTVKCEEAKRGFEYDIGVYCGCTPPSPDYHCSLCPASTVINAKNSLPDGQSCQDAAHLAMAIANNSSRCGKFRLLGSEHCCIDEADAANIPADGTETSETDGTESSHNVSMSPHSTTTSTGVTRVAKYGLLSAIPSWILTLLTFS